MTQDMFKPKPKGVFFDCIACDRTLPGTEFYWVEGSRMKVCKQCIDRRHFASGFRRDREQEDV